MSLPPQKINRRQLLRHGLIASGVLAVGPGLWSSHGHGSPRNAAPAPSQRISNIAKLSGQLREVSVENDPSTRMLLPPGFSVRQVARSGEAALAGVDYAWHGEPDGGACLAMPDGGWAYVSNAELGDAKGGVGALRFNAQGELIDSYSICSGTNKNCAGGPTPWGTWLSCEEVDDGLVYECDPSGKLPAVAYPALGVFKHEAAAVDPVKRHIYLTEDTPDGNLYRFVPAHYPRGGRPDLSKGTLQVAVVEGDNPLHSRKLRWLDVPDPTPRFDGLRKYTATPTRKQVPEATVFNGGEGCWYYQGVVYFTTKGDNRVWALETVSDRLDVIYDKQSDQSLALGMADVDNVTVSAGGDVLVAEDGAHMRLVVVGPNMQAFELLRVLGHEQSEICGPAFSPDGNRLYFSSQNGPSGGSFDGRTYEVRGPFFSEVHS